LIRAVLGVRVRTLIEVYGAETTFVTPQVAFAETARSLPTIAEKRGLNLPQLLETLDSIRDLVGAVPDEVVDPYRETALKRIGRRDPMDWPFVAAALALNCPVWTEDHDFLGAGVPTWTTSGIEIYLRGE
jgi:predicted nucleic acid-binding protein